MKIIRDAAGSLGDDVFGLGPFFSLRNFHADLLAFLQGFESIHLNSGVVYENIRSTFLLNKSVTLAVIEPFHGSN